MGGYASKIASMSNLAVHNVYRGCKRKYIEEYIYDSESDYIDRTLHTPKKRKLLTTAQYIYKTLFQEEKGSDITVLILGCAWRLHKVYISQSPYFASMFSGSWKETNEKVINVEITDPNITTNSLSVVLGSLYQDEVSLEPKEVVSILATSTLFQLQGLIDECVDIMIETTNSETVVSYYNAAVSYGVPTVKAAAKRWLEVNLLGYGWRHPSFLKEISPDLMTELVSSPDLVVLQTEFCIYMMLRLWLFTHMYDYEETLKIDEYFKNHKWTEPFLTSEEGKEYAAPFKALRMKYLLLHEQDEKILYSDNLIPPDWLHNAYREQWLHLLRVDGNKDRGPVQMTEVEFSKECYRCGRCVEKPGEHIWRWKAFHYGLDLLMSLDTTSLRIERNHRLDCEHIKANHKEHKILIKVCLFSLNEQRQVKHIQDSRILRLRLRRNTEHEIMDLDKQLCYPLYVSVNMQLVTPLTLGQEDTSTDILSDT
ncbi:Protein germ cell-less [Trachymyrmex zeteki]|uniref:Protein germ cell-less n=1 Tax=Mycetomoellerius zeteki TaxID=64791 RepID=A0A151WWW2_9HYME|nr:PREDICTED: protein germ cell-less [Trachymyrmex zeteki]KYQ52306.1 Protein germ cell-less [Trachymyrmex zeteki]